jgi:hypothetical protein
VNYRFAVQASNPRTLRRFEQDDRTLFDAIQTVFPIETEFAFIVWNWVYIPITYKYDVCLLIDDIIELLELVLSNDSGRRIIQWPSNTFAGTWAVEWTGDGITLDAQWECVLGEIEAILADRPVVIMTRHDFVSEWKRLLETVAEALSSAGYSTRQISGFARLNALIARIPKRGILYRD